MFQAIYKETRSGLYQTCDMILLCNVVDLDTGEEFRDHCWVKSSKLFSKLNLNINDTITFDAMIHMYPSSNGLKLGLQKIKKIEKVENMSHKKISFKKRIRKIITPMYSYDIVFEADVIWVVNFEQNFIARFKTFDDYLNNQPFELEDKNIDETMKILVDKIENGHAVLKKLDMSFILDKLKNKHC